MEKFLLNFNLLLLVIYLYKQVRHGLHIYQLENYYADRYAKWMRNHKDIVYEKKKLLLMGLATVLVIVSIFYSNYYFVIGTLVLEALVLLFLIIKKKRAQEKKPFVLTARMKRMYVTYIILIAIVFTLANLLNYKIVLACMNVAVAFGYVVAYLVSYINLPIEKRIRQGYINKAKEKLKEDKNLTVVGITGSYGKTSTKYIVNTILSQKYNTLKTPGNFNTTMGVVRTVNDYLSPMHQLFLCEMGAYYPGDIKEITDLVHPKYGILTAIGPQHLDTFKSLENVRKTKLELVDSLPDDGVAFVNWEDENIRNSKISKKTIKYGLTEEADYYATDIDITERGSSFNVVTPKNEKIAIKTRLLGNLNILNVVAGVAVADTLGLTADEIKVGAKYIRPVPHRLELKQNPNGSLTIDDAYNSNIRGATMALEVLKQFSGRKKILITPGIVELADKAAEINQEFGRKAAAAADFVILVGNTQTVPIYNGLKEAKYPDGKIYMAKNLQDALSKMNSIMTKDSVVLFENDLPDNYL